MEALVEVQWWLFSSLFGLALSLSFPPSLPFSSVLPELLSSQINSPLFSVLPPLFSVLLQNFAPRFVPLFLKKKSSPPPLLICSLPCIYRQPGERFTIPCPSAGHGGVGWLLCSRCRAWPSFRHGGGYGSPVSSLMRV